MKLLVTDIVNATGAKILQKGSAEAVTGVSIDTRTIKNGDLYLAIKGSHFDGHDFIDQAIEKGSTCVVSEKPVSQKSVTLLQVNDSVKALGDIAADYRKKHKTTIVAVTGSNGKSTTKEMIYSALSSTRKVVKTEGNFNNLIGLPLQVLRLTDQYDVAVFEMGMNAPGEIKRLAEIASPDVGLITNVNPAHLEKLHTVENVAKAKGELFEGMRKDGTIIINAEDPWAVKLGNAYPGNKIRFGMQNDCDVQFGRLMSEGLDKTDMTFYVKGREYAMRLPVPGVHNVMNALSAIAVGVALKIQVTMMITGIEHFTAMKMRMERIQLLNGVQLINDCYNANPSSMFAALRTIGSAKRAGRFIAVLGDMLELGDSAIEKHRELGVNAAKFGVSKLFTVGNHAKDVETGAFSNGLKSVVVEKDVESLKKTILNEVKTGDIVLVKGSRGMKMEQVVEYLKNEIGV